MAKVKFGNFQIITFKVYKVNSGFLISLNQI